MVDDSTQYERFTLKLIWQEIAPHTWPAAILPVLLAASLACLYFNVTGLAFRFDAVTVLSLLLISILMQSSVNTFNDYYDYVKGVDTVENSSDDVTDAVFVYNNINPRSGLLLAVGLLAAAFVIGVYIIVTAGIIPLIIALVGAFFVVMYSAGKTPISYYPVGEFISGFVMGGLICLACFYVLTRTLDWMVLAFSVPVIIGIGLIMMTNNTCDIQKDIESNRHTLPVILGHKKSVAVYHGLLILMICSIIVISFAAPIWAYAYMNASSLTADQIMSLMSNTVILSPIVVLLVYPQLRALWHNPLNPATRDIAMPQILGVNITLGIGFCCMLLFNSAALTMLI